MKLINRLEKSKQFWFLVIASFVFFLLRFPSLIEPYWYGDEGIYEVIGLALAKGRILYTQIYDNKPPLLYLIYGIFGGDQYPVRLASLITGLLSMVSFFYLSQKLFKKLHISIIVTSLYVLFFATPLIEGNIANAENFMLLPVILAGLIVYTVATAKESHSKLFNVHNLLLFFAGILLGLAFLFKIVGIFDLAAFVVFLLIINFPRTFSWSKIKSKFVHKFRLKNYVLLFPPFLYNVVFLVTGFVLPLILVTLYFIFNNALQPYIQAVFFNNIGYVGWKNNFIIPQGFLILKLILLGGFVLFTFFKRKSISPAALFILLWLAFSLFNALFSQRPYTHYLLVLLPGFCLLAGLIIRARTRLNRWIYSFLLIGVLLVIADNFYIYGFNKTIRYYQNTIQYLTGGKDTASFRSFFDRKAPRDYEVASFINMHSKPEDKIFIWGDNPQIYALSNKLPPGRFTAAYHIQSKETRLETMEALQKTKPRYIITLTETSMIPFALTNYAMKYAIKGALVYERTF